MRKIILFNLVTVDGLFEGPKREIDWHNVDREFNEFAIEQLEAAGGIIFGRITYEMMAGFWPSEQAIKSDPIVAKKMNSLPKWVFSRTLTNPEWNNTRLVKGDAVQEISRLKQQAGDDLYVFGSADLSTTLINHYLIDEYRILVNPLILGKGHLMFKEIDKPVNLELIKTKSFRNGNILLVYRPHLTNPNN